jgi:RNA-dependent RNA polymerase
VHVRKSQEKFKAQYNGLEVIRGARYATATLNRQTITILSGLGVPDAVFLEMLRQQLQNYEDAMTNEVMAMELLRRYVDENQHSLVIGEMVEAGFVHGDVQEPFVATVLNLWKIWSLKMLKEKARLVVEAGAFVMGCVDETATLRGHSTKTEDSSGKNVGALPQIFLQVPRSVWRDKDGQPALDERRPTFPMPSMSWVPSSRYRVVTGVCLVGRNPSLHPGDLRLVEAVDVPALHHLRDVVVFPQTGDRDVPSMLSGGDLDGDDYFVIWDERLLPPRWNYPPMHGSPVKPRELERDVDTQDVCDFFVKYIKSDILPSVALAHVAVSDKLGVKSDKSEC